MALVALLSLFALGLSSAIESQTAGERTNLLSNLETPAASIIFTQRETLVYSTRLALWSNGGTTRREVQIARALLGQRLAVIDSSGKSMGERANSAYWRALKRSDELVAAAPSGILPETMHRRLNKTLLPVIDEIVAQARTLVVSYQRSVDQEMRDLAEETARRDAFNLALLYLFLASGSTLLYLVSRSYIKNFRRMKLEIESEREELEKFKVRVAELQNLDEARNALISNVNHELRTPLTSIIGFIELLQQDEPTTQSTKVRHHLQVLQRNSQTLLKLVESLLSLSKFDGAVGKLPNEPVSINEIAENAIFTMKPVLEKAGITITTELERDMYVRGDEGQLSQVFINLIANAIKFSSPESSIKIVGTVSHFAEIKISDQGIGIPSAEVPYIFERFYRGENASRENYEGTGLGLAIVREVIDHHGGSVEVQSEVGRGTVFSLRLPVFDGGALNG